MVVASRNGKMFAVTLQEKPKAFDGILQYNKWKNRFVLSFEAKGDKLIVKRYNADNDGAKIEIDLERQNLIACVGGICDISPNFGLWENSHMDEECYKGLEDPGSLVGGVSYFNNGLPLLFITYHDERTCSNDIKGKEMFHCEKELPTFKDIRNFMNSKEFKDNKKIDRHLLYPIKQLKLMEEVN